MPFPSASRVLLVAAVLLAGCAKNRTDGPATPVEVAPKPTPAPFRDIADAAQRQRSRPVEAARTAAPPPGLEPRLVEPGAGSPEELAPLAQVVQSLALKHPEPAASPKPPSPADQANALQAYASGREKLLRGKVIDAVNDLKKAAELDPGAGEPWRELGEAQHAAGWRTDSLASFEQALARGLEDPRVLERLGRAASERGDNAAAASLLARASLASPERSDPLLAPVIDAALSRALGALGYTTASRDALQRAVRRNPTVTASTRYAEEYGAIYRRQGELWRDIGDASCRLGQYDQAAEAYGRAAGLPTLDSRGILARRAYAEARCGRPAGTALIVLEDLAENDGRVDEESASLLAYASSFQGNASRISDALTRYEASLPAPVAPSVSRSLARARASVEPAHARDPWDIRTLTAALDAAKDEPQAVATALSIVTRQPRAAERVAQALLLARFPLDATLSALASAAPSEARAITMAHLELLRGHPGLAADVVSGPAPTSHLAPAYALVRLEAGLAAGRSSLVDPAMAAITAGPGPEWPPYRARALAAFQRNEAALAEVTPLFIAPVVDPGARIEDLLLGAGLAISLGRGDDAERYLREAQAIDPYDDRAATRQLTLYGPGGPKAESARLNQVIRELRRRIPDSRTLQAANVKELLRRSLLEQAEDGARRLAEEDPGDPAAVDLLVSIYRASAARDGKEHLARAKEWLQTQLQRRPASPALLAGHCVVLVTEGESEEAQSVLRAALSQGAGPDVSRILEGLLRTELNRPQQADALTLSRLEGRPRLPGESLELAECYLRNGDDAKAASAVIQAFPEGVAILPDQVTRVLFVTSQVAQHAAQQPDHAARAAALNLYDFAILRGLRMSPEMHQRRLALLALEPDITSDRMLQAAAYMTKQFPGLSDKPYIAASQGLTEAGRGAMALVLISKVGAQETRPSPDLIAEWTRVIWAVGTAAHARILIERAEATGGLRSLVERFGDRGTPAPKDWRAEAAYLIAQGFTASGRAEEADRTYELALQYDADHAWACNNLGYSLLERGGDLARVSELLERAHAALPDEAPITDSLGWLRYKQGLIEDERDEAGKVTRRGAASLLQQAAATERGQNDPTILDHVGDAYWLAGRAEEATRYWQLGGQLAARALAGTGPNQLNPSAAAEMKTIREATQAKRRAAESGQPVKVAPQFGNADPQPPRTADPAKTDSPIQQEP